VQEAIRHERQLEIRQAYDQADPEGGQVAHRPAAWRTTSVHVSTNVRLADAGVAASLTGTA